MVTNAGNTDVLVKSIELSDPAGGVITTGLSGITIQPGYTLSSKGVRAAFVYQDGTNFTVIPAVK